MESSSDGIDHETREESAFSRMDPRITFVSAMPRPSGEWTSIQGFSKERVELHWIWRAMLGLPSTVYQLAAPMGATIGLRACGMAGWRHLPVRVDRLLRTRVHEGSPLWVVFSADAMVAELVGRWSAAQPLRPLHVSAAEVDGAIPPAELTAERLREHWLQLVADGGGRLDGLDDLLAQWRPHEVIPASFPFLGHQTVTPNQECLEANGVVGDGLWSTGAAAPNQISKRQ